VKEFGNSSSNLSLKTKSQKSLCDAFLLALNGCHDAKTILKLVNSGLANKLYVFMSFGSINKKHK